MSRYHIEEVTCAHEGGSHRISYRHWGPWEATDPVVCVHGLTRNCTDFDQLAAELAARGRRVICVDLPGRGLSERLADPALYGVPQYLADMMALIKGWQPKAVDWVGTSLGGLIAMVIASQESVPIRRLVLNDVGPFVPKAALEHIATYVSDHPVFPDLNAAEAYLRDRCGPFGPLSDAQWRQVTVDSTVPVTGGLALHYDPAIAVPFQQGAMEDLDLWAFWDPVTLPTLVLRGAESELLLAETAAEMAQRRAGMKLVEFAGCGHAPWLKTLDQISVIADWLEGGA